MKVFFTPTRLSLIFPLIFFTVVCCCPGGKANAAEQLIVSHQMAGKVAHSCCDPKHSNPHSKCNCHNISASVSASKVGIDIKNIPLDFSLAKVSHSFDVAFISSHSVFSFYLPSKSLQSTPPIYLLNRVLRL